MVLLKKQLLILLKTLNSTNMRTNTRIRTYTYLYIYTYKKIYVYFFMYIFYVFFIFMYNMFVQIIRGNTKYVHVKKRFRKI